MLNILFIAITCLAIAVGTGGQKTILAIEQNGLNIYITQKHEWFFKYMKRIALNAKGATVFHNTNRVFN